MDLENAFDTVEWTAMWYVLKVYDVGKRYLEEAKTLYRNAKVIFRVGRKISEKLRKGSVRQFCVMSP